MKCINRVLDLISILVYKKITIKELIFIDLKDNRLEKVSIQLSLVP